eukprot:534691_1
MGDGTLGTPVDLVAGGELLGGGGGLDLNTAGLGGGLEVGVTVVVGLELSDGVVGVGVDTEGGLGVQLGVSISDLHVVDEDTETLSLLGLSGVTAAVLGLELVEESGVVSAGGGHQGEEGEEAEGEDERAHLSDSNKVQKL